MQTLDPTVEGAAEQIRSDMRRMCGWGYQLLKHDFSTYDLFGRWGFQMAAELTDAGWHFADRTRTNAEIFRALYALLREAAGATPLLGCNTVGHLAAGLFEVQRTGDDTSGRDWSRTRKMGVNTLAFRAAQQGAFFDVDADCVGLTKAIPWSLNRQWLDLLSRSGTPLFVSAAPDAVGPEQRSALRRSFRPRRHPPTRRRASRLARNKRAPPLALGKLHRRLRLVYRRSLHSALTNSIDGNVLVGPIPKQRRRD